MALGVALLLAAAGLTVRAYIRLVERARHRDGRAAPLPQDRPSVELRVASDGDCSALLGGIVVGMTSVGSGSLIIIALMALYPNLKASQLVGTDLVQAVPLVASAALGHMLFGDFKLDLTTSLLVGCIPGVWVGAQLSARAPGRPGPARPRLRAAGLGAQAAQPVQHRPPPSYCCSSCCWHRSIWMLVRRRHGFPAIAWGVWRAQAAGIVDPPPVRLEERSKPD